MDLFGPLYNQNLILQDFLSFLSLIRLYHTCTLNLADLSITSIKGTQSCHAGDCISYYSNNLTACC